MQHIQDDFEARMKRIHTARHEANALLLRPAIKTQKLRHESMLETPSGKPLNKGNLVLIRHESREKFEPTYFGPFRILKVQPFGTYTLETMDGKKVLRNLVNGSRLIQYHHNKHLDAPIGAVMTPATKKRLRVQGTVPGQIGDVTPELLEVLNRDGPIPPTYEELSLMTCQEWNNTTYHQNDRGRSSLVGEGNRGVDKVLSERQRRGKARRKRVQTQTDPIRGQDAFELRRPDVVDEDPATVAVVNRSEQSPRRVEGEETSPKPPQQEGNGDASTSVPAQGDQRGGSDKQEVESSSPAPHPKVKNRKRRSRTGIPADESPSTRSEPESVPIRERATTRDLRRNPKPNQRSPIELGI
jgi:hypothetical protein